MSESHAHAPSHDAPHTEHHEEHHDVNYMLVFAALCVLTGLSVGVDQIRDSIPWGVLVAAVLAVAVCKAVCVMLFFMHLKFETGWKYVLLAPTIVLAMAIPAALMPDIGSHYYDVQVPQTKLAAGHHPKTDDAQMPHGTHGKAEGAPEAEKPKH